jgi:hypothetical protein
MTLSREQLAFLEWMVSPREERQQSTHAELAEHLGVNAATIYRWKNNPEFKQALAMAAMAWGEEQLPRIINSLFTYAQTSAGDKDRMTIIRYFMPAVLKARADKQLDILQQPADKARQVSQELAMAYLQDCTPEEQHKFMLILGAMGAVDTGRTVDNEPEPYVVRKNEEDIIDLPQLPASPGRPRGSRKVRLKRAAEDA